MPKKKAPAPRTFEYRQKPGVNWRTLAALDAPDSYNLTEIGMLTLQSDLTDVAAKLESSMTQEGNAAFRYRLETVATLAAIMHSKSGDYHESARGAIALLDACIDELTNVTEQTVLQRDGRAEDKKIPGAMTPAECARYVTGQKRHDRAETAFKKFVGFILREQKAVKSIKTQPVSGQTEQEFQKHFDLAPESTNAEIEDFLRQAGIDRIRGEVAHFWKARFVEWKKAVISHGNKLKAKRTPKKAG